METCQLLATGKEEPVKGTSNGLHSGINPSPARGPDVDEGGLDVAVETVARLPPSEFHLPDIDLCVRGQEASDRLTCIECDCGVAWTVMCLATGWPRSWLHQQYLEYQPSLERRVYHIPVWPHRRRCPPSRQG